jgi:lysozyme
VTTSAQGIDVSSYQGALTGSALSELDFAFAKATDGPSETDPNFTANWAAIRAAGKFRGAYHELRAGNATGQAAWFLAAVKAAGLEPGDMLAVSVSDYPGVSGADAKAFCDAVKAATGGRNPVLAYSDLSVAATLASCTGYDLWIAWPSPAAPESVAPWKTWRLWQWGETGTDTDAYNGTAAEMAAWIDSYVHPVAPGNWTFGPVRNLAVEAAGPHSVKLTWLSPRVPMPLAVGFYQVTIRHVGQDVASYPRCEAKTANPQVWQGGSLQPGTEYEVLVRADATLGGHASPWATVSFTTAAA